MSKQPTIIRIISKFTVTRVIMRMTGKPDQIYNDMPAGTTEHNALDRIPPLDYSNGAAYTYKTIGPKDAATTLVLGSRERDWQALGVMLDAWSTETGEPPEPGRLFGDTIIDPRPYTEEVLAEPAEEEEEQDDPHAVARYAMFERSPQD